MIENDIRVIIERRIVAGIEESRETDELPPLADGEGLTKSGHGTAAGRRQNGKVMAFDRVEDLWWDRHPGLENPCRRGPQIE